VAFVKQDSWKPQGISILEDRAWQALRETQQSVSVTAGAGAGKTKFLAQKATYLLQTGLCPPPKRILAISFKRDAARNLAERVDERCPADQARRFNSFTFDAFTKNLLDRFRMAIPDPWQPPKDYRIHFSSRNEIEYFLENNKCNDISHFQFERALARVRLPFRENVASERELKVVQEYWNTQYHDHEDVRLTFSMINRLVIWLLAENPRICRALQVTFPFVFLDEFQDTTHSQYELLKSAFNGSNAIFTAVGDDKQRIMGWAGAMRDAFPRFVEDFSAKQISLLSNWRSHEKLVRVQHVIACLIDENAEYPDPKAEQAVDGEISSIWEFPSNDDESEGLANWVAREIETSQLKAHDFAILVRNHANTVEKVLSPFFDRKGLRIRNVAREVGAISIQDLLSDDLVGIFLPILRLGSASTSPSSWADACKALQYLEGLDPRNDSEQQRLQLRLEKFIRELRRMMRSHEINPESVNQIAQDVLSFVGASRLRQTFVAYQRQQDFDRIWEGLMLLLNESAKRANTWSELLNEFEGFEQVPLMTIHKSKGLEFHTMVFYGLDNRSWWSLTPDRVEELSSFFVAFTRARQRAFFTLSTERGGRVSWIEEIIRPAGVRRIDGLSI
jgi:superfamily I DNA/RNA helicase